MLLFITATLTCLVTLRVCISFVLANISMNVTQSVFMVTYHMLDKHKTLKCVTCWD